MTFGAGSLEREVASGKRVLSGVFSESLIEIETGYSGKDWFRYAFYTVVVMMVTPSANTYGARVLDVF